MRSASTQTQRLLPSLPSGTANQLPAPSSRDAWGDGGTCTLIQEVGQKATQDGLVADDQHILLPLQLHDHRLQALDQVLVGLQDRGTGTVLGQHAQKGGALPLGHPSR